MNFDLSTGIEYMLHGTCEALNEDWIHISRSMKSYELFYVTSGTLYISDGCNNYTVNSCEYVITPPCENQHGWKPSACKFYYFHWYADCIEGNFPAFGKYTNTGDLDKYYALLSDNSITQDAANHILSIILLKLKDGGSSASSKSSAGLCRAVLSYIQFAPSDELRVSLIAERFKYNEKYLSHCITAETGISLKKHLKNELIKRATHILEYTDKSISRISEQLGYSDAHSFSHVFKNAVHLSPKEYRQKTRARHSVSFKN